MFKSNNAKVKQPTHKQSNQGKTFTKVLVQELFLCFLQRIWNQFYLTRCKRKLTELQPVRKCRQNRQRPRVEHSRSTPSTCQKVQIALQPKRTIGVLESPRKLSQILSYLTFWLESNWGRRKFSINIYIAIL